MCCAIAALMFAAVAAWRSLAKGALAWRLPARSAAALAAGALVVAAGFAFAATAAGGLGASARGVPFQMLSWRICGAAPDQRILPWQAGDVARPPQRDRP